MKKINLLLAIILSSFIFISCNKDDSDFVVGQDVRKGEGGLRYMDEPTKDGKSLDHVSQYKQHRELVIIFG